MKQEQRTDEGGRTREEIEWEYTALWGHPAHVIVKRIGGNRPAYSVADHSGNWEALACTQTPAGPRFTRA